MQLSSFNTEQVKRVSNKLAAYGIEPSQETLQALAKTADSFYPSDPNSLERAAESMLNFFAGEASPCTRQTFFWHNLRYWWLKAW